MTFNGSGPRAIAQVEDAWLQDSRIGQTVRERLFAAAQARSLRRSSHRFARATRVVAGLAVAAAVVGAVALAVFPRPGDLSFTVGDHARRGTTGNWISASGEDHVPLQFSDGTQITLFQAAQLRVAKLQLEGAHVVLERGRLSATVTHRPTTKWQFQAGPFAVAVRGTRFQLDWSPETAQFALDLSEGIVDVTGPGIAGRYTLQSGQSLKVQGGSSNWQVVTPSADPAASNAYPPTAEVAASSSAVSSSMPPTADPPEKVRPQEGPSWQELAAAGSYTEALNAARKVGLSKLLHSASSADLSRLALAARFVGDVEVARNALRSIRERFSGSSEAAMATFDLGRLAFDTSGRYLEAAHWFRDYLREFPHGNLAREAQGRLVEALERGGDHLGAREAASEYLLRFPNGPHSGFSRRLLNR